MSPPCSGNSESTLPPLSHPTASALQTKLLKHLLFHSPLPEGEAMKQARSWHRAQLLDLQRLWELCRQCRISAGLIPMAQPPTAISDAALDVENNSSTVTATPHLFQTPLSTSPQPNLKFHHKEAFRPTAWCDLTSIVCRPQRWQVDSLMPSSKTTKIPLQYCHPTTTKASSRESLRKDSALPKPRLPKGWVYAVEEVHEEVKTKVVDPNRYQTLVVPLTRSKRKAVDQLDDPHCRHHRASSIIEDPLTSPSAFKRTARKYRHVTSRPTSTRPIPL
jgi:hypothetical protein